MAHLKLAAAAALLAAGPALAQNRIDLIRPDAPELAQYGASPIGVRAVEFTDPDRIDVTATAEEGAEIRGPRTLSAEIWYPPPRAPSRAAPIPRFCATERPR